MKPTILFTFAAFLAFVLATGCASSEEGDEMASEMAEQHQGDAPEASTLVREPMIPVDAAPVEYHLDGEPVYIGYMAAPQRPDSVLEAHGRVPNGGLPAVILVHEWWGLNENITAMARRLAGEGYRVLAVDLYGGEVGTTPDEAQALMGQALNDAEALEANLRSAYEFLDERYASPRIAVLGWCFGGMMAMRTATYLPKQLDATVVYYGQISDFSEDDLAPLDMPILGFFGAEDQSIPTDDVRAFEQTLNDLGKDVEVHIYEGAGHAFANPSGRNFIQEAAEDAWDKTLSFLDEQLYTPLPMSS